jgi:hypothetical protein
MIQILVFLFFMINEMLCRELKFESFIFASLTEYFYDLSQGEYFLDIFIFSRHDELTFKYFNGFFKIYFLISQFSKKILNFLLFFFFFFWLLTNNSFQ